MSLEKLIFVAGVGQVALALGSLFIPRALRWSDDLVKLRPLTRQVFWTYAAYILCTNLAFGLVSVFGRAWLLDTSPLAAAVTGFIAVYWAARVITQFTYFDRADIRSGRFFRFGEVALVCFFVFLCLAYGYAAITNITGGRG